MLDHRCFALGAALVVCASVAAAQDVVPGTFQGLEEAQGIRSIVISGSRRFGMTDGVYQRQATLIGSLKQGEAIEVTLDQNGRVASIRRVDLAGPSARRQMVTARWVKQEIVQGRRWAEVGSLRLQISDEVYNTHKRVFEFTDRGTLVRVVHEGGFILDIVQLAQQQGQANQLVDQSLVDRIFASERGDIITVNGGLAKFVSANLTEIVVAPQLPGTNPPEFVLQGSVRIAIDQIKSFDNRRLTAAQAQGAGAGGPTNDVFTQAEVQPGDIVGIGFVTGQIVALADQTYTLRVWRNDEWGGEEMPRQRAEATSVKFVSLTSQHVQPLGAGELLFKVGRSREKGHALIVEVELSHTVPASLLCRAKLRVLVAPHAMTPESTPTATEIVDLPTLFEGTQAKVRYAVQADGALDARVEVALEADSVVPLSSPAALAPLLIALEQATTAADLEGLTRTYLACGKNGSPELAQLLVTRAVQCPLAATLAEQHRLIVVAGLSAFGGTAPRMIVEDLLSPDRNLHTTRLVGGEIQRLQMGSDDRPLLFKRRLLELMGEVEGGLVPPHGPQVFDLYLVNSDLGEAIEAAFTKRPADAVATLLDVAASVTPSSTADEQRRAEKAAQLLQRLGGPILPALLQELRRREIAVDTIEQARESGTSASDMVHQAIGLLVADAGRRRRIELDQQVEQARALISQQAWDQAAPLLRAVLELDRGHEDASELMPQVLQAMAAAKRPTDRAAAAGMYRQALPYLQPAEQARVKGILGEMALEALLEELEDVAIRSTNSDLGAKVRPATVGEQFAGRDLEDGWVEVAVGADTKGYIRRKCMRNAGPETFGVQDVATPYDVLDLLIAQARDLSPTLGVQCNEALGHLCAREAAARVALEDYKGALPLFERAKELAPTDPRLEQELGAWLRARKQLLFAVAAILALIMGFVAMQMFARPRRVKFEGEFKHYGADRARRERDLDVDGEKTGGDPAPPPAGEAPPAGAS